MVEKTYLDFDLWLVPTAYGYLVKGRDTYDREATGAFEVPFDESEIEEFWHRIDYDPGCRHRHAAGPENLGCDDPSDPALSDSTKILGSKLFEALLRGQLKRCFYQSLDQADRDHSGLRIRIRLADAPELAKVPWEYLYDADTDRFFALSVATPVVRYLELPERLRPLAVRPPLEMLVMIASPSDYEALDVELEWRRLNEALEDLIEGGSIRLKRLQGTTLDDLRHGLRRVSPHIFHFIGHGDFDQISQEGMLILEDDSGLGVPVRSEDLGVVLRDGSPRLVVLNACEGAHAAWENPFAGVAQTLIRQGVPAVVAMQSEVLDELALTLAHELYSALADGFPVDACLTEARKALAGQQQMRWGAPVLYLRAPDGSLFDFTEAPGTSWGSWASLAALLLVGMLLLVSEPWKGALIGFDWPTDTARDTAAEHLREGGAAESLAAVPGENHETSEAPPTEWADDAGAVGQERSRDAEDVEQPAPRRRLEPDPSATSAEQDPTANKVSWPPGSSPGDVHLDERDGQSYAWVPAGRFRFGCSPGDDRCEDDEVHSDQEIRHGFWLGQTEVTVRAYKLQADPSALPPAPPFNAGWHDESQPMVNVNREDAAAFCALSGLRLPTEIEWEYAARAEERRALPADLGEQAWFAEQEIYGAQTVGRKEPNTFGLYDMLGNAGEWVGPIEDPGDSHGSAGPGIIRGGSFRHERRFLRYSFRLAVDPDERNVMIGFRCLAEADS